MSELSTPFEEVTLRVKGLTIAAKMWGPKDGYPVIAAHGWLDNCGSFDPIMPLLKGMRVCAMDFAGHGFSDHRPEGVLYNFLDYMSDIIGVANELGWEKFALLGHSMGAGVSLQTTAAFQERVTHLMLIDAFGPPALPVEEIPQKMNEAITKLLRKGPSRVPVYKDEQEAKQTRFNLGGLSWEGVETLCLRGLKEVEGGITWRTDARVKIPHAMRLSPSQIAQILKTIKNPVIVVMAEEGFPWDKEALEHRMTLVPQLEKHTLPGHHHLHMEEGTRETIAELFNQFMEKHLSYI